MGPPSPHADSASEAEDVLDIGPRRRMPVWTTPVAVVVAAAAVLTVVLVRHSAAGHQRRPAAVRPPAAAQPTPTPTPTRPADTFARRRTRLNDLLGTTLYPNSPVFTTLESGHRLYILMAGEVREYDISNDRVIARQSLGGIDRLDQGPSSLLLLDSPSHRLWLLGEGVPPQQAIAFDSRTLQPLGETRISSDVQDAAVGFGDLYLATNRGLESVVPGAAHTDLLRAHAGGYLSVSVDQMRHRLLLGGGTRPVPPTIVSLRGGSKAAG